MNRSPAGTETPLMCVAGFGDNTWVKMLIEAGAEVNRTDVLGRTALMGAIAYKHNDCTRTLLKAGADVNVVDKKNKTALYYAASTANKDCITWLLDAGAKVKDDVNGTYINVAVAESDPLFPLDEADIYRCIQRLLKVGDYINQARGENALKTYIMKTGSSVGFVQMLLLAAGETANDKTKNKIMKAFKDQNKFSLKHLSREAVRKQMISARPHNNLIEAVLKLGIPPELESYLVYDVFLDDDESTDFELHKKMVQYYKKTDSDEEEDIDDDMIDDDSDDNDSDEDMTDDSDDDCCIM